MASNEQWAISSRAKQIRRDKRRQRAQRMHMQAQQRECGDSAQAPPGGIHSNSHNVNSGLQSRIPTYSSPLYHGSNDDEDSDASHDRDSQRVQKNLKNKNVSSNKSKPLPEPLYEEDVIDGFAIISFSSYDDLEAAVRVSEKTSCLPDPLTPLDTKDRVRKSKGQRSSSKSSGRSNGAIKGRHSVESNAQPSVSHLNGPSCNDNSMKLDPTDGGSRDARATSTDRFSDASRHSSSSRGYLCDSESEENDKPRQELRVHSPTVNRASDHAPPAKSTPFSPGHSNTNNSSSNNSNSSAGENCNLRWVGLAGSPRPATAVAPLGPLQNGPRLPDCQPTEGGAGPSPAPPAAPSPRLPSQPVGGSPLNTFHSSSPHLHSLNPIPVLRSGFIALPTPFSAPSTSPSIPSSSISILPPVSYSAPPFYTSVHTPGPVQSSPPTTRISTVTQDKISADIPRQVLPSVPSPKLPPPPPPPIKPPSPYPLAPALRPPCSPPSVTPSSNVATVAHPPITVTSSSASIPCYPPTPIGRVSFSTSAVSGVSSFITPPSPVVAQQRHTSITQSISVGEPTFHMTKPSYSIPSFIPTSPRIGGAVTETSPSVSRPPSQALWSVGRSEAEHRPGGFPFQTQPHPIKSPSVPPPPTPSFSTQGTWPRPPHPESSRPSSPGIKRTSPITRAGGRLSPVKDPLPLVSRNCSTQSSSVPQYSDLLRRELDSRFLSSAPGLPPILPPPLAPPQGAKLMDSPLFRPLIPSIGLTGLNSPYSALPTGLTPPVPPHSVSYTPTSTHTLTSGSLVPPHSGGMLGNLGGIGLPPVSSVQPLPSKSKPGRWNAMHVRLAWEIYRNQQRQQRDQQPDQKKNPSLMPKYNPGPLPPPKLGGPFEILPSPLTSHSSSFGFTPHSVAGFLPRLPSASNQHSTPPPPQPPQPLPPSTAVRLSPAPDQWNRLPRSSPMPFSAPWLAPLVPSGPSSSVKVEASSSASATTNHMLMKERERQKREEREREREREKERNEKLEREKERERERRRHASRSPITIRTSTNGPVKTESASHSKVTYSLSNVLPSIPPFHPELSQPQPPTSMPSSILDRSRLGLPMSGLYGQSFDPFRDVLRGIDPLRDSLDREPREFMRFAPPSHLLPGPPSLNPALFPPHSAATAGTDRYRDFVGMSGLPSDRFRDGLQMPPHLGHMAGPLGIPLGGPPGGSLNDRYREGLLSANIPGMSGPSLFPPVSASFQFPPGLGPPSLLGSSLGPSLSGGGLSSLAMLPPSLLTTGGKRTPPPPTSLTPSLSNPLVSLSRTHMGMVPPTLGLPPYPLPSPSPMLNPHLIPSLAPSLNNTRPPSTPPVGRSLLDLQPPLPAGLPTYNPLDYPRKDDPQSR